jgi:hypothetical protein
MLNNKGQKKLSLIDIIDKKQDEINLEETKQNQDLEISNFTNLPFDNSLKEENFEAEISTRNINPDDKLTDFAKIKISAIDENIKRELNFHIKKIKNSLHNLKSLNNHD